MAWLTGFSYRKSHVINYAAGAGTLYQKQITVHYGSGTDGDDDVYLNSHSRTDFGDVRFTDDDGSTELDYWMESKVDGDYAVFWVEVADDLSSQNQTIYVYYGKADATTTSNGYNTFLVFANFNDGTIDGFTIVVGSFDNPSDYLRSINTGANTAWKGDSYSNYALACKVRVPTGITVKEMGILARWTKEGADKNSYLFRIQSTTLWELYKNVDNVWTLLDSGSGSYAANTWYKLELRPYGTALKGYINDADIGCSATDSSLSSGWAGVRGYNNPATQYHHFDDFRVRKFVDPEPSHGAWGSEETGAVLKEVMDSLSLSDVLLCNKTFAVTDSVGLADATLKHWTPQISDSIALSDSILRNKMFQILDSLGLSDTILRGKQFSVSDSISLSELITVITEIIKQVTDSLSLSDIVGLNKSLLLADQIQLTDNVYVNKILIISDYMALAEVVEKSVQGVVKTRIFLIMGDLAIQLTGD